MHLDHAVQSAPRDTRTHAPRIHDTPATSRGRLSRLLRAYVRVMRWYVTDGRTPVAAGSIEVGHLPRPRFVPKAAPSARATVLVARMAEAER